MRLLVIVSGDFGELGTAIYFLRGLPCAVPPLVLVPAVLATAIPKIAGVEWRCYESRSDVDEAITQRRPDTVLLACGYLLAVNAGLSLLEIIGLIGRLRRRQVTLLTTDPFLGLLPRPALPRLGHRRPRRPGLTLAVSAYFLFLSWKILAIRAFLRPAWRIYAAPLDRAPELAKERSLSFYNASAQEALAGATHATQERPAWLFVLSRVDFSLRTTVEGDGFVDRLAERLRECLALGRRVVVIAPASLVHRLQALMGDNPHVIMHTPISYDHFMHELMAAEYAFYWNTLSFSVLHRLLAARPVFFFDEGHFVHIFPSVGALGVRFFYDGWRPPLLSMERRLDSADLAHRAAEVSRQFKLIGDGMRRCPTPAQLLARAGGGGGKA